MGAMTTNLSTWELLHTTPQQAINEGLEEQAQSLSGTSWIMLVDSESVALAGNMFLSRYLWLTATPDEDLKRFEGLNVAIHPQSEESRQRWQKRNFGKVLSVIPSPLPLIDAVINTNQMRL